MIWVCVSRWLQFIAQIKNYFRIPSLETQDAFSKRRSSSTASAVENRQASPVAAAEVAISNDEDYDWDLEDALGLDDVEQVRAKCRLRDFQNSCCPKKCNVSGTTTEVFVLESELVKQMFL